MEVYLAGSMTHQSAADVGWVQRAEELLHANNIGTVVPHDKEDYAREYDVYSGVNLNNILTTRDKWAATGCDIVLANFGSATKASIGTSIELGWADEAGVPIIAVIPSGNIHEHPMVL